MSQTESRFRVPTFSNEMIDKIGKKLRSAGIDPESVSTFEGMPTALSPRTLYFPSEKLGDGSYGKVFLGAHLFPVHLLTGERTSSSERLVPVPVAVKIGKCRKDPTSSVTYMLKEAEIMASLSIRNVSIPMVFDYGEAILSNVPGMSIPWRDEDGSLPPIAYCAMQLLGKNLNALRKGQRNMTLPRPAILALGACFTRALQAIHKAGYLHRDVKPSNMLVGESEPQRVYISDFGLADKCARFHRKDKEIEKDVHGFAGSRIYASLALHNGYPHSARDDIESLVYSLIHLGTGSMPWKTVHHPSETQTRRILREAKSVFDYDEALAWTGSEAIARALDYCRRYTWSKSSTFPYYDEIFTLFYDELCGSDNSEAWLAWLSKNMPQF